MSPAHLSDPDRWPCSACAWAGLGTGLNPHPQRFQVSDTPLGSLLFLPEKPAAHLEARLRPLDAGSGVRRGGEEPSRVPRAQVGRGRRGWQVWVREPKRVVSSPRSKSAWRPVPLPLPLALGPIPRPGLSSELYIPPSWALTWAESPVHSLVRPRLGSAPAPVRGDGSWEKPASGPRAGCVPEEDRCCGGWVGHQTLRGAGEAPRLVPLPRA